MLIPSRFKAVLRWAPLLLITATIFVLCSDFFNNARVGGYEAVAIERFAPSERWGDRLFALLPTAQHFFAFFLLGLATFPLTSAGDRKLRFAILYCGLVALSSELGQAFTDTRHPAFEDVALNLYSSLTGIAAFLLVSWLRQRLKASQIGVLPQSQPLGFPIVGSRPTVLLVSEFDGPRLSDAD